MDKATEGDFKSDAWPDEVSLLTDRVEQRLRHHVQNLRAGAMLPTQEILVQEFGASRHTIREAMDRLKRDRLVQSTRGKGTFVVSPIPRKTAVHLISTSMYHVYSLMCIGVLTEVLREQGHLVHLVGSRTPSAEWRDIIGGQEHSAGAILIGNFSRDELQSLTQHSDLPLVHVSDLDEQYRRTPLCDTVINDNAALAFLATEHLIRQGHRRIALLGWGHEKVWDRELHRGFHDALRANGIEPQADWILRLPESFSFDSGKTIQKDSEMELRGRAQIERWRKSDHPPTALLHSGGDELLLQKCVADYFGGMFDPMAVVALASWETLLGFYTAKSDATAVCIKFRDIAERAVDLLHHRHRHNAPPTREMQGRVFVAQRRDGRWMMT